MLESRHPWDSSTCPCGSLTVSGLPWQPKVSWTARPGTGWSDVPDADDADDAAADDIGAECPPDERLRLDSLGFGARVG